MFSFSDIVLINFVLKWKRFSCFLRIILKIHCWTIITDYQCLMNAWPVPSARLPFWLLLWLYLVTLRCQLIYKSSQHSVLGHDLKTARANTTNLNILGQNLLQLKPSLFFTAGSITCSTHFSREFLIMTFRMKYFKTIHTDMLTV